MTPSQSARYDAGKEFRRTRYTSKKPWLSHGHQAPVAMITIEYTVISGEGDKVVLRTWVTGKSSASATGNWKSHHRSKGATFTVVTEPKKLQYEPVGPLQEPAVDTITEYLATG